MKKLFAGVMLISLILAGCGKGGTVKSEKENMIAATRDVTCMVFQAENLMDPSLEQKSKDIFKKYGFDADDDKAMEELGNKYKDDKDLQDAVTKALEECGGDLFKDLGNLDVGLEDVAVSVEEEKAAEVTE